MISAASIRSASSSPPAICPDRPTFFVSTSVSRSSSRSVASRTREASARTAFQRSEVSARRVVARRVAQAGERRLEAGLAGVLLDVGGERVVDRRDLAVEQGELDAGDADRLLGAVVVDRLDVRLASSLAACVSITPMYDAKRGATMSAEATSPSAIWRRCGTRSRAKIAVRDMSRNAAIRTGRVARVNASDG